MKIQILPHRVRRVTGVGAMALALVGLGACSIQDSLLEQQQPQVVKPGDVQNATGAIAIYNGGVGRLRTSLNGGDNNTESIWNFAALLSDEMKVGDTFSQRIDADQRATQTFDAVLTTIYNKVQQSRGYARDAINNLQAYAPTEKTKIGEMYLVMGFMEATLGQDFCNGIPLGETVGGVPNYTDPLTNAQVFTQAIARYDTALTFATATDPAGTAVRNATLIAKARALVDLGQFTQAAALVPAATIPTAYAYMITYSIPTQVNEWWQMSWATRRYSVGDTIGLPQGAKNNLPFASAGDPRVLSKRSTLASFDGLTPFDSLYNWGREDPVSLVNGLDARLIEAEAQLQTPAGWAAMNAILNTLRATPPKYGNFTIPAMTALPLPLTKVEAEDQFFREKAFWQYGRGERLSDMRRLIRQYGRNPEAVFPTGAFHKSGVYGTGVNFPVPDAERSNPKFNGCLDRSA